MLPTRDQGRESKRGESDIRQGDAQSRALAYMPRAATTASGVRRQFLAHAPPHQFRKPLAAGLPLPPEGATHAPPDPRIQTSQHRRSFTEAEVASPAPYLLGQFLYHLLHAIPLGPQRDLPNPLLEPLNRLRRNLAPRLWLAREAESQKLPLRGFATALFDSFTLSFSLAVMNRFTLSITRCPARSLRT